MTTFRYQNSTKPLTLKQQRFLVGYKEHGNATRAAREAGYGAQNAATAGYRLLQHPLVKVALREAEPIRAAPAEPTPYPVKLPSGLEVSFSYKGRSVAPSIALAVSQFAGSESERGIWRGGLALLSLLVHELDN